MNATNRYPLILAISSILTLGSAAVSAVPADSDYEKDKTQVFVNERSGEVFEGVNEILCEIAQTQYADSALLNQDWQRVLVDSSLCSGRDSASNSDSSSSGSSESGAKTYNTWIVKSERLLGEDAPHELSAFVHTQGDGGDRAMVIQAKVQITEAATDANPTGLFSMSFKGNPEGAPASDIPAMRGVLKAERNEAGQVVIQWAEEGIKGPGSLRITKAAMTKSDTAGQGSVFTNDGPSEPGFSSDQRFDFRYDANLFHRVNNASGEQCLNRTQFETSAWRYGLYKSDSGARAVVNSGFPINTSADGKGSFGYLGYYGLFLPPGSPSLGNGAKVYKNVFDAGKAVTTPYTLVVKGGKLKQHLRKDITLDDIKNIQLEGSFVKAGEDPSPGQPMTMYRLSWDGSHLAVRASAQSNPGQPPAWQDVNPPQNIEDFDLAFPDLMFHSEAMGGDVRVKMPCTQTSPPPNSVFRCSAPTGSTLVYFFELTTITQDDGVPASLVCYNNCPKIQGDGTMSGSDSSYPMEFPPTQRSYTFNGLMLQENGFPLELKSTGDSGGFGFNSGPLFEATSANLDQIKCEFDPNQVCAHKAFELEKFYTWETGSNSYNMLTLALDGAGQPVHFDPPLMVSYTYPVGGTSGVNPSQTDSRYAGTRFQLQYGGFGDLHGIPGKCSNPDNPADTDPDCSKPGRRWVPEFTIPAGSLVSGEGSSFLVKPLEVEQRMIPADLAQCNGLGTVDLSGEWPDLSKDWTDPALGTEPTITAPPKVIAGVVQ